MPDTSTTRLNSVLRNRITGERFNATGKPLKIKKFTRSVEPDKKSNPESKEQESIKALLHKMTERENEEVNTSFTLKLARQYPDLWPIAKMVALLLVSSYFPVIGAASSTYSCTTASWDPTSACELTDTSCRFGTLSKDNVPLTKFMTKVVKDKGPHDSTPFTFRDCMDLDKMCDMLKKLFNQTKDASKTLPVTAQGPTVNGTYLYATVDAVPTDVQSNFQGLFSAESAKCNSFFAKIAANLKLLALLTLIAIPVAIWVYRKEIKEKLKDKLSCPNLFNSGGNNAAANAPGPPAASRLSV